MTNRRYTVKTTRASLSPSCNSFSIEVLNSFINTGFVSYTSLLCVVCLAHLTKLLEQYAIRLLFLAVQQFIPIFNLKKVHFRYNTRNMLYLKLSKLQ